MPSDAIGEIVAQQAREDAGPIAWTHLDASVTLESLAEAALAACDANVPGLGRQIDGDQRRQLASVLTETKMSERTGSAPLVEIGLASMAYWQIIALVLIGIAMVLLPFVVIAVSTSTLLPQERRAFLMLYGAAILLVGIAAADTAQWLPSRLVVDVTLLVGGFALGAYAGRIISGFRRRVRARP